MVTTYAPGFVLCDIRSLKPGAHLLLTSCYGEGSEAPGLIASPYTSVTRPGASSATRFKRYERRVMVKTLAPGLPFLYLHHLAGGVSLYLSHLRHQGGEIGS